MGIPLDRNKALQLAKLAVYKGGKGATETVFTIYNHDLVEKMAWKYVSLTRGEEGFETISSIETGWGKPYVAKAKARAKEIINDIANWKDDKKVPEFLIQLEELGNTPIAKSIPVGRDSNTYKTNTSNDPDFAYAGEVYTLLNKTWEEPKTSTPHQAKIEVSIDKDGGISSWKFVTPSNNERFNKSIAHIFDIVKKVNPPPSEQAYFITVNFEAREEH